MASNPSIERTSFSRLRLLTAAAHVERQAPFRNNEVPKRSSAGVVGSLCVAAGVAAAAGIGGQAASPAAAAHVERQTPVNTRCPSCGEELSGKYLGAIQAQCSCCSAYLVHNTHPSEERTLNIELRLYAFVAVTVAAASMLAFNTTIAARVACLVGVAVAILWLVRTHRSLPADWQRRKLAPGEAIRRRVGP